MWAANEVHVCFLGTEVRYWSITQIEDWKWHWYCSCFQLEGSAKPPFQSTTCHDIIPHSVGATDASSVAIGSIQLTSFSSSFLQFILGYMWPAPHTTASALVYEPQNHLHGDKSTSHCLCSSSSSRLTSGFACNQSVWKYPARRSSTQVKFYYIIMSGKLHRKLIEK